jgi:hypothetical protein
MLPGREPHRIAMLMLLPETRGRNLASLEPEPAPPSSAIVAE